MKNVRATVQIMADKLFVKPWSPNAEQVSEHEKKKAEDPAYAETPEAKAVEGGLLARAKMIDAFNAKGKDNEAEVRKAAVDVLPQVAKEECSELGVELPIDDVTLHLDLGDLLMCAYYGTVTLPAAPVAKARVQMKIQRLAMESQKDEFDLGLDVMAAIDNEISDDAKWEALKIEAYVMKGDQRSVRVCNSIVTSLFPEVVQALIEIFSK